MARNGRRIDAHRGIAKAISRALSPLVLGHCRIRSTAAYPAGKFLSGIDRPLVRPAPTSNANAGHLVRIPKMAVAHQGASGSRARCRRRGQAVCAYIAMTHAKGERWTTPACDGDIGEGARACWADRRMIAESMGGRGQRRRSAELQKAQFSASRAAAPAAREEFETAEKPVPKTYQAPPPRCRQKAERAYSITTRGEETMGSQCKQTRNCCRRERGLRARSRRTAAA